MRPVLIMLVLAMAGCRANIPDGAFRCDESTPCPPMQQCVAGVCYAGVSEVDAGFDAYVGDPPDAFIEEDALALDAFVSADAFRGPDAFVCPSPCGVVPQCGCSGGQVCTLGLSPMEDACGAPGTGREGEACSGTAACGAGLACSATSLSPEPRFICRRVCRADVHEDCTGEALCINPLGGREDLDLCTLGCSPVAPFNCPADSMCVVFNLGGATVTECVGPVGTGTVGSACTEPTDCAPGYACAGDTPACRPYCNADMRCTTGTCSDIGTIGSVVWGACVP